MTLLNQMSYKNTVSYKNIVLHIHALKVSSENWWDVVHHTITMCLWLNVRFALRPPDRRELTARRGNRKQVIATNFSWDIWASTLSLWITPLTYILQMCVRVWTAFNGVSTDPGRMVYVLPGIIYSWPISSADCWLIK